MDKALLFVTNSNKRHEAQDKAKEARGTANRLAQ
jgi:hypothetical protein